MRLLRLHTIPASSLPTSTPNRLLLPSLPYSHTKPHTPSPHFLSYSLQSPHSFLTSFPFHLLPFSNPPPPPTFTPPSFTSIHSPFLIPSHTSLTSTTLRHLTRCRQPPQIHTPSHNTHRKIVTLIAHATKNCFPSTLTYIHIYLSP